MTGRRWFYPLMLALPFLVVAAALEGLTVELATFHGSDARSYHLPTIMQFARELPTPDLARYPAAQAPLFHLLFAAYGKVVGFDLWKLQSLGVVISYLAVVALFHLLSACLRLQRWKAFLLSLLFALSPYFFGASFILLTDNLAILFALVALILFVRSREKESMALFALACVSVALALLTRQAFVWLLPVGLWYAPRRMPGAALLALSFAPLGALVVAWGGLVPKGSDPTSCGLCPGSGDNLLGRSLGFTFAVFAIYAVAVLAPSAWRQVRPLLAPAGVASALLVAVVLLIAFPLEFVAPGPGVPGDAGYLWRVSEKLPLLFWLLVPLGTVAAYALGRRAGPRSLAVVFGASFLLSVLPVRLVYQKYFDPFALTAVFFMVRPGDLERRWQWVGVAALAVGFVGYAVSFEV
jgi:4-amino-4-deoxy-L-arabinose transferase-like glycosyltransferase